MMKNQFKSLSIQAVFSMATIFILGIHTLCALALPVQPDTVHVSPPIGERETDLVGTVTAVKGGSNRMSEADTVQDTIRFTLLPGGIPMGERTVWWDAPNIRHYQSGAG